MIYMYTYMCTCIHVNVYVVPVIKSSSANKTPQLCSSPCTVLHG